MFVKLTADINFTNILPAAFLYKMFLQAFLYIYEFMFVL